MMPTSSLPIATHAPTQRLTVADFTAYEHRYHLTHHFPSLPGGQCVPAGHMVAEGRIDERQPWQGLQLVGSDLIVHQTYETHARRDAPAHVSIIVLLEGCAELALGDHQHTLRAGDGLLLAYDRRCSLKARHVADQRVRAVNLTVVTSSLGNDPRLTAHLAPLLEHTPGGLWPVAVPAGLRQSLADWLAATPVDSLAPLMAEGLALQLMAHGLAHWKAEPPPSPHRPIRATNACWHGSATAWNRARAKPIP